MTRADDDELHTEPVPSYSLSCIGAISTGGRARRRAYELDLPLIVSGEPELTERADEHLAGFGER